MWGLTVMHSFPVFTELKWASKKVASLPDDYDPNHNAGIDLF